MRATVGGASFTKPWLCWKATTHWFFFFVPSHWDHKPDRQRSLFAGGDAVELWRVGDQGTRSLFLPIETEKKIIRSISMVIFYFYFLKIILFLNF